MKMKNVASICVGAILMLVSTGLAANKPAVLFYGSLHDSYVVKPLVGMGVDVDVCGATQLVERLASGKYNVAVVGDYMGGEHGIAGDPERKALDEFMARGGGVLITRPQQPYLEKWTRMNEWLTQLGARPRWDVLQDSDPSNVVTDVMNVQHSWSDQIDPRVKAGVRGVLTYIWSNSGGKDPTQSYDFGPEWTVLVRGAASMRSAPDKRHEEPIQPWVPKSYTNAPALLAARDVGKGRMAVTAVPYAWAFSAYPSDCPSIEIMLSKGTPGKPSDWLRVFANVFQWLAEPSLKAGMGGAQTPALVLNPPSQVWEIPPAYDWSKIEPLKEAPQTPGLVGARTVLSSGKGTVAEYVKEGKAAGLRFIVFLEDSLKMDQARWDKLIKECDAASSDDFAAIPGLTYEDAQGNHLYVFADDVRFPKPAMLLKDGRLATTNTVRTAVYFDYINELIVQKALTGFWNHKANFIPPADYKLYNSFPVFTHEDGKPVDDAMDDFLYLQGIGGCQAILAFEMMSSPAQVSRRVKDGWRVVWMRDPKDLRNGKFRDGAWSFCGMGSQYITQGPSILAWSAVNNMAESHGLWWRPDEWEFRMRLKVASDAGLKSVEVRDADRSVLRHWLTNGDKTFERDLVLANSQQQGLLLIVEDTQGRKAVSMAYWNRNLMGQEFICSDRCNFLGDSRLRSKAGEQMWTPAGFKGNMGVTPSKGRLDMSVQPAISLTQPSPTLPIDGQPIGFPVCTLNFELSVPGEYRHFFAYPTTYLMGPDIAMGQGNYRLAYDPADVASEVSPLGHPYGRPFMDCGNAWSSWYRLIPPCKVSGWSRTVAGNWIPPNAFRIGWHETDVTLKDAVTFDEKAGMQIMYPDMAGWVFYRDGKPVASPGTNDLPFAPFERGVVGIHENVGGCEVLIPMEGPLQYRYFRNGNFTLSYKPPQPRMEKGSRIHYQVAFAGVKGGTSAAKLLEFAEKFGVTRPGQTAYAPTLTRGKQLDNYLVWRLDGKEGNGIEAKIPKVDLPGLLTCSVEGLNDNWSVQLLDRGRKLAPPEVTGNTRSLPIREGRAYAQLDLTDADSDLFIGHPVTADNPDAKLLVAWQEPGVWCVEAHNPGDKPMKVKLNANPGWTVFDFKETVELAAGSSRVWTVKAR